MRWMPSRGWKREQRTLIQNADPQPTQLLPNPPSNHNKKEKKRNHCDRDRPGFRWRGRQRCQAEREREREREREKWSNVYARMRKQGREKIKRKERGLTWIKKIIYVLQLVNSVNSNLRLQCSSMPNILAFDTHDENVIIYILLNMSFSFSFLFSFFYFFIVEEICYFPKSTLSGKSFLLGF